MRPYSPRNLKTLSISLLLSTGRVYYVSILPKQHTPFRFYLLNACTFKKYPYIQSLVGIVYSWDYDGIWSSSIPQLSFLINENIFVECFRFCLSFIGHWISPLSIKYKPPHLFLFFDIYLFIFLSIFFSYSLKGEFISSQICLIFIYNFFGPCLYKGTLL